MSVVFTCGLNNYTYAYLKFSHDNVSLIESLRQASQEYEISKFGISYFRINKHSYNNLRDFERALVVIYLFVCMYCINNLFRIFYFFDSIL
jgi:hypothetical protein